MKFGYKIWATAALGALLFGCARPQNHLVLYSDMDMAVVKPLVTRFEQQNHVQVDIVPSKGAPLADRIRDESGAPQADVYWAAEPASAEQLRADALLQPATSDAANQTDDRWRASDRTWHSVGMRVRVLLINTRRLPGRTDLRSITVLTQAKYRGKACMGDPRTDLSARYHVFSIFASLSKTDANALLQAFIANRVRLLPDERAVASAVASGQSDLGIVDSDLAFALVKQGKPVRVVLPDQLPYSSADGWGRARESLPTLGACVIPCPLMLIKGRPHDEQGSALLSYLLSADTAAKLAETRPGLVPTNSMIEAAASSPEIRRILSRDKPILTSTARLDAVTAAAADALPAIAALPPAGKQAP